MGAHELAFVGLAGSGIGTALGVPMLWPRPRRSLDVRLLRAAALLMSAIAALISARLPHQVSEALNRYAGVSFHDQINRRRVEDVKEQLLDPASERFTIEGVGASAGFGSRSALDAAFRRFEGMTPTRFRRSRQDQAAGAV